MVAALGRDELGESSSSRRSQSIKEVWQWPPDVFSRNSTMRQEVDWAAIERLPTYDRLKKGMLQQVLSNGRVVQTEVDVTNLGAQDKKLLMDSILGKAVVMARRQRKIPSAAPIPTSGASTLPVEELRLEEERNEYMKLGILIFRI